jgi:hypothetical protein
MAGANASSRPPLVSGEPPVNGLVAIGAGQGRYSPTVFTSFDIHSVEVTLITLEGLIAGDVTILAARTLKHGPDGLKSPAPIFF